MLYDPKWEKIETKADPHSVAGIDCLVGESTSR